MDNCCDSLLKYILFILNFFLFVTGAALIGIGAYIQFEMNDYLNFLDDSYLNSSVVFIVLGVVILIIGFFGCCGACTENGCMMGTFATLLAIVVLVQIGLAVAVFVFKGKAHEAIVTKMTEGMTNYAQDPKYSGVTDTWNVVQSDFDCCGVNNYTDWKSTPYSSGGGDLPDSCCTVYEADCGKGYFEGSKTEINQDGCFNKLEKAVVDNVEIVGGVAIAVLLIQIILVLISCMLANNMRRRSNYV